ncbi:hypothetical protein BWQ96_00635 [Gracilariopsis chorda]|uniref:Uncharacterized protein n=1 Tax=Gracilariopsis chorda TaxID=448386 RepID=A0A2V3J584_9FLOR|nr:hypothetical protein BWQ96_00635 [Gracilariopsis chorda]|eukprot:PXF49565.1 hypothetical protein BWQ96_00635 [Gracilariopsis chorda]
MATPLVRPGSPLPLSRSTFPAPSTTSRASFSDPSAAPAVTFAPGSGRKKRIHFSAGCYVLLVKAIKALDAHIAPHDEAQARLEEALALFFSPTSSGGLAVVCTPTWKTLSDRLKKVISSHRLAVGNNAVASGIIEEWGETGTLLDDIMLAIDEVDDRCCTERDERSELEKRLWAAREDIR